MISRNDSRPARRFPRWRLWSFVVGVLLLIIGFVTFLPTIGHGDGELQIFTMALGAVILLVALTAIVIAFIAKQVKSRR